MSFPKDNKWHDAIVVQHPDGTNVIYKDKEDAERRTKDIPGEPKWQPVKVNWNKGHPIVDLGDFKVEVVDIDQPERGTFIGTMKVL